MGGFCPFTRISSYFLKCRERESRIVISMCPFTITIDSILLNLEHGLKYYLDHRRKLWGVLEGQATPNIGVSPRSTAYIKVKNVSSLEIWMIQYHYHIIHVIQCSGLSFVKLPRVYWYNFQPPALQYNIINIITHSARVRPLFCIQFFRMILFAFFNSIQTL